MISKNRVLVIFVFTLLASQPAFAHGEQMWYPMSADLVLIFLAIALLFKYRATWTFRIVTFVGAFAVIIFTWFLIGLVLPDDKFGSFLIEHTALLSFVNWSIKVALYAPIYWIAHKRFLTKEEILSDGKFKKVVCPKCGFKEEVNYSEVLSNNSFIKYEAHLDSKWEPYLICPECQKKFSFYTK
jgi:hypothetical protein